VKKHLLFSVMSLLLIFIVGCSKEQMETITEDNKISIEEIQEDVKAESNLESNSESNTDEVEEVYDAYEAVITLPEGYNQMQNIIFFQSEKPDGSNIPELIRDEASSDLPYMQLKSDLSAIVIRGWAVTDFSGYIENGYIELEVKGNAGGESFEIGFEEFNGSRSAQYTINSSEICAVTTEWTTVRIPISSLCAATKATMSHVRQFLIGKGEGVSVRNIFLGSPDKEKSFPVIKVNQLGYKCDATKHAIISGYYEELSAKTGDRFELVNTETQEAVYTGRLVLITLYDKDYSGEKMLQADFSEYCEQGTYFLRLKNSDITASPIFKISEDVYDELLTNTMRYFYYQRANTAIVSEFGGNFTRLDMTPRDFKAPLSSDRNVLIDVSGGWYDAGDVGKYVSPGATAVNTLLWAYKLFPEKFSDGQNHIPESGNGIPDILDEIRYELDFLLRMQDTSGGFYIKVKSKSEDDGDGDRTIWHGKNEKCTTNATADCTAVLAFASTIYEAFDMEYATTLRSAAQKGWEYLVSNPNVYVSTNYSGENNQSSMFWASACVYYAMQEETAKNFFEKNVSKFYLVFQTGNNGHNVGNMGIYGYYTYLLCENKNDTIASKISSKYIDWYKANVKKYESNPWNIAINEWSFWWGSFNIILGNVQDMYIGNAVLNLDQTTTETIAAHATDFILGKNAMGKCYITGMGSDPIKCTFSNIYDANSEKGFPAGYMPGGLNSYNGGEISRFPLKCYADEGFDWYTNENAIYWNAVMVFNSAIVK